MTPAQPRSFFLALCSAAGSLAAYPAVAADITLSAAATSDYRYRGISQSDENPALQLGIDVAADTGWFVGAWASTSDIDTRAGHRSTELDVYAGFVRHFADDWSVAVALNRYTWPGAEGSFDYDYTELSLTVGYRDRIWLTIDRTNSLFGHDVAANHVEVVASRDVGSELTLEATVGHVAATRFAGDDYWHWSVGLARSFGRLNADLRFVDTSGVPARFAPSRLTDAGIVFTLSTGVAL